MQPGALPRLQAQGVRSGQGAGILPWLRRIPLQGAKSPGSELPHALWGQPCGERHGNGGRAARVPGRPEGAVYLPLRRRHFLARRRVQRMRGQSGAIARCKEEEKGRHISACPFILFMSCGISPSFPRRALPGGHTSSSPRRQRSDTSPRPYPGRSGPGRCSGLRA